MINSLKEWIVEVEAMGELQRYSGVSEVLEMGALTMLAQEKGEGQSPALLFENIPGYAPAYKVLTNSFLSHKRIALSSGIGPAENKQALTREWKKFIEESPRLIPPKKVATGPVMEHVLRDDEVDLTVLPAPVWHELDNGRRYLGTGSCTIMRDPDTGRVNLGTYRVMVHDRNTVGFYMDPGRDGSLIRQKYFERGLPCPVVISLGHDPLLFMASNVPFLPTVSEYDIAGGLRGAPVEVVEGELSGLPIPAWSEIVLEGESYPGQEMPEGPFGEFTGYYASGETKQPFIKVSRVYYQSNPIILGAPPVRPPFTNSGLHSRAVHSALIWSRLEKTGITDIQGVWAHEAGSATHFMVISLKQKYAGHAAQVAFMASQIMKSFGRYVITVDEDIDPSNLNDVVWAMSTRCDPADDIDIIRRCWSSKLDPIQSAKKQSLGSRAIIDACIPYDLRKTFPASISVSEELRKQVKDFADLL